MAQKYPVNENTSSSHPKYGFEHYKTLSGITDDLAPPERLQRLHTLFKTLAAGTQAISDNLQPGELSRRLSDAHGHGVTPAHMKMLLDENRHAIELLRDCMLEMSLCSDKRRIAVLTECNAIYRTEASRLKLGIKEFRSLFGEDTGSAKTDNNPRLSPAVNGLVLQALPLFLVIEDIIAA